MLLAVRSLLLLPNSVWPSLCSSVSLKDWGKFRTANPYAKQRHPRWTVPEFWTEEQERIVAEVYDVHKNKFTKQWSIDVQHMCDNVDYFGEALALCEEFDLLKIMEVNCDFDI